MSAAQGSTHLRVLHVSPGTQAVDIYFDGILVIPRLSFGQASDYADLRPGGHDIRVLLAGTGAQSNPAIEADLSLNAGRHYTFAAVDRQQNIHAALLDDDTSPPGAGMVKLRAFHASPDAPGVDVAVPGGPPLFHDLIFQQATPFAEMPAGAISLEIRPTGSMEVYATIPDLTLAAGNLYTLVALGMLQGAPPFRVMPIVDPVPTPAPA